MRPARPATCHPERKHEAHGLCNACYRRARRAANPEPSRAYDRAYEATHREEKLANCRRWKYGTEPREVEGFMTAQDGLCAICAEPFKVTPNLDHDHGTGKARGLLCSRCNRLLGKVEAGYRPPRVVKGCPDWRAWAEEYLEKGALNVA